MDTEILEITKKVKRELADFLGIGTEDIDAGTTLREDLHMDPASLTDFMDVLQKSGLDLSEVNLTEIETFEELVEALTTHI